MNTCIKGCKQYKMTLKHKTSRTTTEYTPWKSKRCSDKIIKCVHVHLTSRFWACDFQILKGGSHDFLIQKVSASTEKNV